MRDLHPVSSKIVLRMWNKSSNSVSKACMFVNKLKWFYATERIKDSGKKINHRISFLSDFVLSVTVTFTSTLITLRR